MDIPNVQGLDTLHQALSEALEIEKCSICLERLESTVLLWPCTHWFCKKCISTLHQSSKGEKVTCPLCKCATSRRKVLPFQDRQTELQDHLQTLIGALSLDLKFDVTSYNNVGKSGYNIFIPNKERDKSPGYSPLKKNKIKAVRTIEVQKKQDISQNKKRLTRKTANLCVKTNINTDTARNNKTPPIKSSKQNPILLPETPDSPKEKKVKEWLDSNKFSQADQDANVETVIADVHNAEQDESLCFSETALQSVSQAEHGNIETPIKPLPTKKPIVTPSDVNAIKVSNLSSEKLFSKGILSHPCRAENMPVIEKFDEIFPENRKMQAVTTTYGSKNPYTSTRSRGRRYAVQADLFKSIDESKDDIKKSSSEEVVDNSEETLEDFSSGSGEEWTIEKRPKKCNVLSKGGSKNNMKEANKKRTKKVTEKEVDAKHNSRQSNLKYIRVSKTVNSDLQHNSKEDSQCLDKSDAVEEFTKPKTNIVKEIIDDWNDTKDSYSVLHFERQKFLRNNVNINKTGTQRSKSLENTSGNIIELTEANPLANIENKVASTPCKDVNSKSPGWSRLKSTKKEFHLSEKKRLSLKTFNKSNSSLTNMGISPLHNNNSSTVISGSNIEKSSVQSDKNISLGLILNTSKNNDNKSKYIFEVPCDTKIKRTPELENTINTSHNSSASGSPFRGFPEVEGRESSTNFTSHNKETPQKSSNILSLPEQNCEKIINRPIEANKLQDLSLMEVEKPSENHLLPKNMTEHILTALKTNEERCKLLEKSNCPEKNAVAPQEELNRTTFSKKRERDSGIHNESGFSSPVRKKVCRDVEVQTSPSRMESAIRDMLKDICGMELEDIIKQSNKEEMQTKNKSDNFVSNNFFPGLSQDSDKENVNISSKNQKASNMTFDDSDLVFGTEEPTDFAPKNTFGLKNDVMFDNDYVDPEAPTQRYKTPLIQKKPLHTSTKEYTIVSNPTSSEIKKTDSLFEKTDNLFPDETPKAVTPWNYSGVNQLDVNTESVKKTIDENAIPCSSQNSKEKTNRSRRQLDFVGENSNDIFSFNGQTSSKLNDDVLENGMHIDQVETLNEKTDELDDIFMQSKDIINEVLNTPDKYKMDSTSEENETVKHQENVGINVENENLTESTGMVGPSENQYEDEVNNGKQSKKTRCDINVDNKMLVVHSSKMDVDIVETRNIVPLKNITEEGFKDQLDAHENNLPIMKEPSTECKTTILNCDNERGDEGSDYSSDVSFVEGTPDVSQNEPLNVENVKDKSSVKVSETNSRVPDEKEIAKSETTVCDPSLKNRRQIEEKEEENVNETVCNQMTENTEVEDENLCFASSLLNLQQNQVLACVLGGMGLTYSKTVGPHISHLIVGTKNGCFQNTYKVLLAMALHKPIIRFDWVEEVIRTGGTVPLDPFVALDPSGECGVLRAKADKNRTLLQNFAIHIYNVNDRVVLKEQIEELVRLCGGIVVKELNNFNQIPRDKFRIIVLSEPPDSPTQGDWRQKYSAVEVMIDWVYNTIGRYRVMPLVPFMLTEATDAVPFLLHEGYPKELIFDLSTQE